MEQRLVVNYYIDKILKEKTITSFLEERGIFPQKKSGDKSMYLCPIHQGDTTPSFVVYPIGYKGREYQTYYCFSCHSGITLINLKKDIDGTTSRESIKSFLKGFNINYEDARKSIINDWKKGQLGIENNNEIEKMLLTINTICRNHIQSYNDEEEIEFFESFFKEVDKIARARDIEGLNDIFNILTDRHGLIKRVEKFQKRQDDKTISSLSWKI